MTEQSPPAPPEKAAVIISSGPPKEPEEFPTTPAKMLARIKELKNAAASSLALAGLDLAIAIPVGAFSERLLANAMSPGALHSFEGFIGGTVGLLLAGNFVGEVVTSIVSSAQKAKEADVFTHALATAALEAAQR